MSTGSDDFIHTAQGSASPRTPVPGFGEHPAADGSLLLSERSASSQQRRIALVFVTTLLIAFLSILAIGDRPLGHFAAYVPMVDAIMFMNDVLTAVLIYSQYSVGRQRSSLVLAMGYLFAGLIIAPHTLTFPGNFSPTGLLGANANTAFWLYYFCRMGLFVAVIAYSLLKQFHSHAKVSISSSIAAVLALVVLLTWVAIDGGPLPRVMLDSVHSTGHIWSYALGPALVLLNVGAIALLWPQRSSALSLWLLVAQWAWLIETMLLLLDHDRFSVFWYGGIFGQIASCFLVVALLYETTTLYARVAMAAEARSREGERQRLALQVVTGSVAHELQQPLMAVVANGEAVQQFLAQQPPNLEDARVAMNDVVNEAQRAGDIIRSINATLEGARSPATPLSIDALVHDALKLLRSELRTHDVTVELEVASNLLVLGHRSQLVQVLVNLITNAIEAMADVKDRLRRLTIRAQLDPSSKVSIEVTDSGGGIDGEDTARIFDPFFTTKSRGTGLGLAICRQIIESHDGDISATAADHGAVFQIILPSA